ncbi:hypothetical protein TRFO_26115 [Tritrichomonas foetus]|uniref:Uncharacterized protein n=1 Tax=Tritrichomonas foetus TaxID=1144522 RepID=A0A1J4K529_9EUKA|nr:hypothetical protein TRFO_26115 [Tritrichomonas foetus]|eukprot:OHT05968.1 hypothetical protein TRFO_26115 [Tritrichomonas foetus]
MTESDEITISFREREFQASKRLLLYYLKMLPDGKDDLVIEDEDAFEAFLKASQGQPICFTSRYAFELQYLSNKYQNVILLNQVNELIESMPPLLKAILQFRFDKGCASIIAEHFTECVKIEDLYSIDIDLIIEKILNNPGLKRQGREVQAALVVYAKRYIQRRGELSDEQKSNFMKNVDIENLSPGNLTDLYKLKLFDDEEKLHQKTQNIYEFIENGNKILEGINPELDRISLEVNQTINELNDTISTVKTNIENSLMVEDETTFEKISRNHVNRKKFEVVEQKFTDMEKMYQNVKENAESLNNQIEEFKPHIAAFCNIVKDFAENPIV